MFENKSIGEGLKNVPVFEVSLVRKWDVSLKNGKTVEGAASVLHQLLDHSPVEKMVTLYLDYDHDIVGAEVIAVGGYGSVSTTFQNLMRGAIISGAPSVIIGHNHANGSLTPSDPDLEMTGAALTLGTMLGVEIYDHIIVTPDGKHFSLFEHKEELMTRSTQLRALKLLRMLAPKHPLATPLF